MDQKLILQLSSMKEQLRCCCFRRRRFTPFLTIQLHIERCTDHSLKIISFKVMNETKHEEILSLLRTYDNIQIKIRWLNKTVIKKMLQDCSTLREELHKGLICITLDIQIQSLFTALLRLKFDFLSNESTLDILPEFVTDDEVTSDKELSSDDRTEQSEIFTTQNCNNVQEDCEEITVDESHKDEDESDEQTLEECQKEHDESDEQTLEECQKEQEDDSDEQTLEECQKEQEDDSDDIIVEESCKEQQVSDDIIDEKCDKVKEEKSEKVSMKERVTGGARSKTKTQTQHSTYSSSPPSSLLMRPRGTIYTFLSDVVDPPATLVMGADKYENDNLIAQATDRVVFFHVDDMPSAHVYLLLEHGESLRDVPTSLLQDAAQLCKANSSQGKKLNNVSVIYTSGDNLLKTRDMKPGEVGFHSSRDVKKLVVKRADDKLLSRLNATKAKVVSAKVQQEQEQRTRQRQLQKAQQKEQRRKLREHKKQLDASEIDAEESQQVEWATEPEQTLQAVGRQGRRRRRERRSDDDDQELKATSGQQVSRRFPVLPEQRQLLQGCRAQVESRHDVRVDPPKKGATDAHGTVTGALQDVDEALIELRRILYQSTQSQPTSKTVTKGKAKTKNKGKGRAG